MSNMIYDIRTTKNAQRTLASLTNVPIAVWKKHQSCEHGHRDEGYLVKEVIKNYGSLLPNYKDLEFIYFHITTSSNECTSFLKHGILDLKKSYLCHDSELRNFLEERDVHINLDENVLTYARKIFDITYGDCPSPETEAYNRWSIGRKFYFDYNTCGFLSVCEKTPYGGEVHFRPEILINIDNLLGLKLSEEWTSKHEPYEVVAKVSSENVEYDGEEYENDEDKVMNYLIKAYYNAFGELDEHPLLIKYDIQIPSSDILEIKPMEYWKSH